MVSLLSSLAIGTACITGNASAFVSPATTVQTPSLTLSRSVTTQSSSSSPLYASSNPTHSNHFTNAFTALLSLTLFTTSLTTLPQPSIAAQNGDGASLASNAKLTTGGASTLQSGRTISITRGVNLDNSNFSNQNLKGVAFQQSIVRDSDFSNSNLYGASFFDATLDGSNFENADMTLCNVEMAQFNRANLKNAIVKDMYVSGATLFEGVKDIEGSDWSETQLRKDQQKYLCNHPTAKGTNPVTGVDTRESLMCLD
jgi:uncharacterized protein YjbI with pentapeptide repeats|eukprot:g7434.t1 g7434   contig24:616636-617607(+)